MLTLAKGQHSEAAWRSVRTTRLLLPRTGVLAAKLIRRRSAATASTANNYSDGWQGNFSCTLSVLHVLVLGTYFHRSAPTVTL